MEPLEYLTAIPIYFLNGILYTFYIIKENIPFFVSTLFASVYFFYLDPYVQNMATARPLRKGFGEHQSGDPVAQYMTAGTLAIWLLATTFTPDPIPAIGAGLWFVGVVAVMAGTEQQMNQLWWSKSGIIAYSVIAILLHFGASSFSVANTADWASLAGSSATAESLIQSTRGSFLTIGVLFLWAIYPIGYITMLFKGMMINPKPLFSVFRNPLQILKRIRDRE